MFRQCFYNCNHLEKVAIKSDNNQLIDSEFIRNWHSTGNHASGSRYFSSYTKSQVSSLRLRDSLCPPKRRLLSWHFLPSASNCRSFRGHYDAVLLRRERFDTLSSHLPSWLLDLFYCCGCWIICLAPLACWWLQSWETLSIRFVSAKIIDIQRFHDNIHFIRNFTLSNRHINKI